MIKVCTLSDIPAEGGACVKVADEQIALFNIDGKVYATQNMCPHKQQMVLSRGICGSQKDTVKVSCPLHKRNFCLETGKHLGEEDWEIKTYPVEVKEQDVYLKV